MFNNTFAREDDDVRKGGKKSIGEEIDILSACSAHLSRARLATWPLTHVIAWAAVLFFFLPASFFPPYPLTFAFLPCCTCPLSNWMSGGVL